jgi:hypothetical protein
VRPRRSLRVDLALGEDADWCPDSEVRLSQQHARYERRRYHIGSGRPYCDRPRGVGKRGVNGRTFAFRFGCRYSDAGLLRAGGPQPLVHLGICRRVRTRIDLRLSAGRMALRLGRGRLVRRSSAPMVEKIKLTTRRRPTLRRAHRSGSARPSSGIRSSVAASDARGGPNAQRS